MSNLSYAEIQNLAMQRLAGNVVFAQDVPDELLGSVFMPLLFMSDEQKERMNEHMNTGEIGELYQFTSEAGPRAINGFPMFMSFRTISKSDLDAVIAKMEAIKATIKDPSVDEIMERLEESKEQ